MKLLGIPERAALAELADMAPAALTAVLETGRLDRLQQSQRRRLACALQVSLRKLSELNDGVLDWIDDADRYSPFSSDSPGNAPVGQRDRWHPVPSSAGPPGAPRGTPILGRIVPRARIELDTCWDESTGSRLPDGEPDRRDTFALRTPRLGQFVVIRNANSWDALDGATVAIHLSDDRGGVGYFGQLNRQPDDGWAVLPFSIAPDCAGDVDLIPIEPERVQRVGRMIRSWNLA